MVRVASISTFLVMKGMALHDRLSEKDAWDVDYCLRNYPGGLDALINALRPLADHPLVREGLGKIALKFASPEHVGPKHVADFEGITDDAEREITQRASYERIAYLMNDLGVRPWAD